MLLRRLFMRIAVLTTGRQDWTGLMMVVRALADTPDFEPSILAGGMHGRGGPIPNALDGHPVAFKLDVLPDGDTGAAVADAAGRMTSAVGAALEELRPDALLVLGDRTETLASAVAATCLRIPIVHLHGGEETEGAVDNVCRHALTKLSHVHFVAHESFARRLLQMGESPRRVIVAGAPALDYVRLMPRLDRRAVAARLGLRSEADWIVCTHHPATLGGPGATTEAEAVISALRTMVESRRMQIIITRPNVDEGHSELGTRLSRFASEHAGEVLLVDALGAELYFSVLQHAVAMVGNSSSGLIEAPLFQLPAVNVGDRQRGRLRGPNVIDVGSGAAAILDGIERAISPETRQRLVGTTSPYGDGHAAERIVAGLREIGDSLRDCTKAFVAVEEKLA